eukprot:CAMPEP_0118999360 /NCGR_PEP_ID=MMETSP1173-20130426/63539_1 /TAXON_ID=1034831 /ORGANISM="Rhizochromulina marina cf, Strain CCMP1243" /LENGTH=247 /DNA_ID=CAMNT_0006950861 /DNA_START=412 /DNA_END=1156 /DNA_ORIENTATION=-
MADCGYGGSEAVSPRAVYRGRRGGDLRLELFQCCDHVPDSLLHGGIWLLSHAAGGLQVCHHAVHSLRVQQVSWLGVVRKKRLRLLPQADTNAEHADSSFCQAQVRRGSRSRVGLGSRRFIEAEFSGPAQMVPQVPGDLLVHGGFHVCILAEALAEEVDGLVVLANRPQGVPFGLERARNQPVAVALEEALRDLASLLDALQPRKSSSEVSSAASPPVPASSSSTANASSSVTSSSSPSPALPNPEKA